MVKFSDFFSSLFGPPEERLGPDELPRNIHEEFEQKFNGRLNPGFPEHSRPFGRTGSDEDHHQMPELFDSLEKHLFRDAEDMFNSFFSGLDFGFQPHDQDPHSMDAPFGSLPDDHSLDSSPPDSRRPLRDRMLHDPRQGPSGETEFGGFWSFPFGRSQNNPGDPMDRDLDSEVEQGTQSLDDIITPKEKKGPFGFISPHSLSSSSSISSVTIVDSNGVTEKRVTRRGSGGDEEETITRQIGDQSHTVTRRRDGSGNEETQEDLVNIEQGERDKFDEKWSQSRPRGPVQSFPDVDSGERLDTGPLSTVLDSIMEQFFPRRPR